MDVSGLAAFGVNLTCTWSRAWHVNFFNRCWKEHFMAFLLTVLFLCHHLIMSRIADSQQMWFLWLCYEAVNTCQISMRPNLEEAAGRFLWSCQMFSRVPHSWGETSLVAETWCDCKWTHSNRRPLAICRRLWKYLLALHVREIPLAAFPLWFSIIYEGSSGGKGYPPPGFYQSIWHLLAGSRAAILECIYSKAKPIRVGRQMPEDTHMSRI